MIIPALAVLPLAAVSPLLQDQKIPPPVAYETLWLAKDAAKDLRTALTAVKSADPELHALFLQEFDGALLGVGPDGGLRFGAGARRWQWTVPPAALEFGGTELAGTWAWRSYLRRVILERRKVQELAGSGAPPELLERASRRLVERATAAAIDAAVWAQKTPWKLGLPPRKRKGKPSDKEPDPALGIAVIDGSWVLAGSPADCARLRQVLAPLRADPEAARWLQSVQVLMLQEGNLTSAAWFYEDKEVGVALGVSGAANRAAAVMAAGLVDKVRGRAVAVAGQGDLVLLRLSGNVLGMAVWWHDVTQVRNPPTAKETEARMRAEEHAFLERNDAPG